MNPSIFRFIWRHSAKQQVWIILVTLISFPFLYYSLELPKLIVNEAIGGTNFPRDVFGYQIEQIPFLFILSGLFLALALLNGGFKYYINTYKGRLGERLLRRLRFDLYGRVLRFPLSRFRRVSSGEIIPMITAEVEPLGGFMGDAFALPVFQGGMLLVYIGFIFVQDPVLGAAAISLYPIQGFVIPRLQRKVNLLGKERVRTLRSLSDRIGESVSGIQEIHAHDTAALRLADVSHLLARIYNIRFEIYQRKFFIKFLNNFLNQLTPFFFYAIGGYLVIIGRLDLGALVAVLAAYKDLAAPWKELLDYYQLKEDVRIKYEQVIDQFQPTGLMPVEQQLSDAADDRPFEGTVQLSHVSYSTDESTVKLLDGVSAEFPVDSHVALIGTGNSGKDELLQLIARLVVPTSGRILIGGRDLQSLPESVTGRRLAYVGQGAYLFAASLYDNLVYPLRHRPLHPPHYDEREAERQRKLAADARMSGNVDFDTNADWIDYQAAGCQDAGELRQRIVQLLQVVDLDDDVYHLGLIGTIDPARRPDVAERALTARAAVRAALGDHDMGGLVEPCDPDRFNQNASIAENLLFGTPVGPTFACDRLAQNRYVLDVLRRVGLVEDFVDIGKQVAETMIELFADLPPGHEFFEQFSFISSDELPDYQPIVARANKDGLAALKAEERQKLLALPFKLIPARHRLGLIDERMQARILAARRAFAENLPEHLHGAVEFFAVDRYNAAASLLDNILFGKMAYGQAQVRSKVGALVAQVVEDLHLKPTIVDVGLDHNVGVGGSRLSAPQRQKVAIARALLKNPDIVMLSEPTSILDAASQERAHPAIRAERAGRGLVWAVHQKAMARDFDQVLVLQGGATCGVGNV